MEDMDTETIADRVQACFSLFRQVLIELEQSSVNVTQKIRPSDVRDEIGRFRLWCGNIAAHRKGKSSLDYRLREASHISGQARELLRDLRVILEESMDRLQLLIRISPLIYCSDPNHDRKSNSMGRVIRL